MEMGYSININWREEFTKNYDKWENCGRQVIEQKCKHKDGVQDNGYCEKCEVYEDTAEPMMNFGYPLEISPDDDKILEVVEKTNCTVMYNSESEEYFLALTGGGMDLSQDIALAYHILEKWIPYDLAINVCTQKGLSVGGKNWERLRKAMIDSLKNCRDQADRKLKEWEKGDKNGK